MLENSAYPQPQGPCHCQDLLLGTGATTASQVSACLPSPFGLSLCWGEMLLKSGQNVVAIPAGASLRGKLRCSRKCSSEIPAVNHLLLLPVVAISSTKSSWRPGVPGAQRCLCCGQHYLIPSLMHWAAGHRESGEGMKLGSRETGWVWCYWEGVVSWEEWVCGNPVKLGKGK